MKFPFHVLAVALLGALLFNACSKDDDSGKSDNFFTCEVDGTAFEVSGQEAYATASITEPNEYRVYGVNFENNFTIYITLSKEKGTGEFTMDDDVFAYLVDENSTAYATLNEGGSGTVTVDELTDDSVSGTFSFTAVNFSDSTDTKTVTEGTFEVAFQ